MSNDKDLGIYLQTEKVFYYLEGGNNYIGNSVERVRKTLIQRGLILPSIGNLTSIDYTVVSIKYAKNNNYNMKAIYLSKHIKKIYDLEPSGKSSFK